MRNLLIFLLIVYIASDDNHYIYDINLGMVFVINGTKFNSNKVPIADYYFRIPVENPKETYFQVKFLKKDNINFKIKVSGFYQFPNDSEVLSGTDNYELEQRSVRTDNNFIYYTFVTPILKKQAKIKYIVFTVLNKAPLDYLIIYSYPTYDDDQQILLPFTIYNIKYMKEEILNKAILDKHKGIFVLLLENEELGKNKLIRIKISNKYSPQILGVGGFKEKPITQEEFINADVEEYPELKSLTKDENYNIYEYPIESPEVNKQKYIGISVRIDGFLDYISFYIGPES